MCWVLDDGAAVVAAHVAGHLGAEAVHQADLALGRDEREGLSDPVMRDGVVIEVKADVGLLAGGDGEHEVGLEAVFGQGQQSPTLLGQRIADRPARRIARDWPSVSDAVDPVDELGVEVADGGEAAGGEEGVAKVLDGSLDLALGKGSRLQRMRRMGSTRAFG